MRLAVAVNMGLLILGNVVAMLINKPIEDVVLRGYLVALAAGIFWLLVQSGRPE